jgi:hypothetical protein
MIIAVFQEVNERFRKRATFNTALDYRSKERGLMGEKL